MIAGKVVVVAGYGDVGKGSAESLKDAKVRVIVTEVDEIKALEAAMDGFRVMPMLEAARIGDIFCTVTGNINVITKEHFKLMKDGAVVCNSGHFDVEVNVKDLAAIATSVNKDVRRFVDEYIVSGANGNVRIYLLGEGRLINLAAAEGHPASVMDMSFSTQALAAEWMVKNRASLTPRVYNVEPDIEIHVATLKLKSMGLGIDTLTEEQVAYLASWQHGT